jgi:hypothetical protein
MTHQAKEQRRAEILAAIPGWYRPAVHLAIPSILGLGVLVASVALLESVRWTELLAIPITLLLGFGFEWRAHKYILHERAPGLGLLYRRHELMHHVLYTYDDMQLRSPREMWMILMPAYAIVLVFFMLMPIAWVTAMLASFNVALLVVSTSMIFFLAYEWLHLAYHLPADSFVGRIGIIRRLREVHRRHHDPRLMKRWNFNVTLPLFDWLHGTLWSPAREDARRLRKARLESRQAAVHRSS